jgi:hypothetical protein
MSVRSRQLLDAQASSSAPAGTRVRQRGLQSQAGNRAQAALLEPRSVQREPDSTEDPMAGIGGLLAGLGGDPLPGFGAGLLDVGSQALHGVESFAREIPGVGGLVPSGGGAPASTADPMAGIGGVLAGLGGYPLPGFGAGLLDVGSQALHGVESFAREIPGLGGLIPGGGAAAPPHAKHAGHRGASHPAAAQHRSAHQGAVGNHASAGHHQAKHGSGHPSASRQAAKGAKSGGPGLLESMHEKARLMQFEAGALDTAATVGTGISNFAHEIPFVNELL